MVVLFFPLDNYSIALFSTVVKGFSELFLFFISDPTRQWFGHNPMFAFSVPLDNYIVAHCALTVKGFSQIIFKISVRFFYDEGLRVGGMLFTWLVR